MFGKLEGELMSQGKYDRVNYHSDTAIARATAKRINLIKRNLNFENKVVFDLGCSGGFVAESLIEAKRVVAVDADREVIQLNELRNSSKKNSNIEYRLGDLLSLDLQSEGKIDVILMLSVIHHLFCGSEAYSWNNSNQFDQVIAALKLLTNFSNTFVLEVGMPYEGYDWCAKLPYKEDNVSEWLCNNLFGRNWVYTRIDSSSGVERLIKNFFIRKFPHGSKGVRLAKKILKMDIRDTRPIIIFEKKHE